MKIPDKTQQSSSCLYGPSCKVKTMTALNHPNTMRLFEVIETEDKTPCREEHLVSHGSSQEKEPSHILPDSAIRQWHQNFIISGDLKTENQLLDADKNIEMQEKHVGANHEGAVDGVGHGHEKLKPLVPPLSDYKDPD
uniref:non-specific serine/threonine protein kinase n=1 Tax=Molossus molossus TaxID=27622 RepID=A0A7J8I8M0_MOLMO|nr:hypothetical protein HJG59_010528 [Molossus molossus]